MKINLNRIKIIINKQAHTHVFDSLMLLSYYCNIVILAQDTDQKIVVFGRDAVSLGQGGV